LPYPAPRGEIASDEAHARSLISHGVLCCARADTTIDRQDAHSCPNCQGTPCLKTDSMRIWQECPACGHADRDLILTLSGLRSKDVGILFADFRMARYLSRGAGRRYAGAFGRSVRCRNCHGLQLAYARPSAWDRTELHALLRALEAAWDPEDESGSVRRAAYLVARRISGSRTSDIPRLEDSCRRLIDSGAFRDDDSVKRLESGISLCCGSPLMWSEQGVAGIFLDIELLLNPAVLPFVHPDLAFGQAGIRKLLALSE